MVPQHVTIIMDGNGRWAKGRGMDRLKGHNAGADSVRACCKAAVAVGVKYLSIYAFSEENWGRPETEVKGLMALMARLISSERALFLDNGIRFLVIGNRSRLGKGLLSSIEELEQATAGGTAMTLIVMLSYSGKWDIMQAVNRCMAERGSQAGEVTAEEFEKYLATASIPDPDLLIRTSGEQRISNYMLWQTAYTEFYFTDVLWPDFGKEEFCKALESYKNRDRRYGKIK